MKTKFRFLLLPLLLPLFSPGQSFRIYKSDTINRTDAKGLKQGIWKRYWENDTLFSISFLKNGKAIDTSKTFYKTGKPEGIILNEKDGKHAAATLFHENGKLKATGFYVDRIKDSTWNYFNEDGKLTAVEGYKTGIKHGTWRVFYENGQLAEETFWINGKREGIHHQYFKDGNRKAEIIFKNDTYSGIAKMFHTNSKLWFAGNYKKGLREGSWVYFNEEGVQDSVEIYRNGELIPKQ